MKNLYKIIFLSFFFFITFNLTEAKAADYPLCDPDYTNASGEINLGAIAEPKTCMTRAEAYEFTIYEVHLCTSAPTAATTSRAIIKSSCELVFENSTGSTVSLSSTEGESENLIGNFYKPPNGNYTHAYLKIDNVFGVTGSATFSDQDYRGQGNNGSGNTCVTRSSAAVETLTGTTFPQETSLCGDGGEVGSAGKKMIQLQSLDCCDGLVTSDTETNINGTNQIGQPSLVDSNGRLITSEEQADVIDYIVTFGSAKTIDENTSGLNLAFNISSALEVHTYSDNDYILFMFGPPVVFIDLRSS